MSEEHASKSKAQESPLSLSRLREAFAAMLGDGGARSKELGARSQASSAPLIPRSSPPVPCEISPRSVVEALLFVGRPENGSFSSRELASAMRGVSPTEIDAAVLELNSLYEKDQTPYVIDGTSRGYRLTMRREFQRMRDKFYGTVREAKLSPAAMEVLSIIAYNQPVTAERINELRKSPNGAAISTLVRRQIVKLERPGGAGMAAFSTTERFLRLFGLESLEELPRSEEVTAG